MTKKAALLKDSQDTEMVEAALKRAGCEVIIYSDREALLAAMREERFALVAACTKGKPYEDSPPRGDAGVYLGIFSQRDFPGTPFLLVYTTGINQNMLEYLSSHGYVISPRIPEEIFKRAVRLMLEDRRELSDKL
ncbi:MAG: hypothetical protein QW331_02145 [Candidatus Woesearchaeota archaeon]